MENPNIIYGQITAYFDIAGFSFEKAMPKLEYLLQEKKWKEIGTGYNDINDFLRSLTSYWSQWKITAEQRKRIASLIKENEKEASNVAIADMLGMAESTIRKDISQKNEEEGKIDTEYQDIIIDTSQKNETKEISQSEISGEKLVDKQIKVEEKKEKRKSEIEKQKKDIKEGRVTIPEGKFNLIVIDPSWEYKREYDPEGSRIASPYPEMDFNELSELKIPANDNCILWLWTTHAFIWDAKELLKKWGFEYKAILVWDKEKMGMGSWLRMQCEFCLLGIKGKPVWDIKDLPDIIRDGRKEHSRKPRRFYEIIEGKFDFINKYCDYFSREKFSDKWECGGNDINKFKDK